jgi:Flp pilus assembly protein TadD
MIAAMASSAIAGSAMAQTRADMEICKSYTAKLEQVIASCSAIIASPTTSIGSREAAYVRRGFWRYEYEQYELSIADLTKAVLLNPKDADAYFKRGVTFEKMGRKDQAVADYARAFAADSHDWRPILSRAMLYHQAGNDAAALPDAQLLVVTAPKDAAWRVLRGEIYEGLGRRREAIADYRAALKISPCARLAEDGLGRLDATVEEEPPECMH